MSDSKESFLGVTVCLIDGEALGALLARLNCVLVGALNSLQALSSLDVSSGSPVICGLLMTCSTIEVLVTFLFRPAAVDVFSSKDGKITSKMMPG
jgi:hypothetical protein